jgi:hypothetical protein
MPIQTTRRKHNIIDDDDEEMNMADSQPSKTLTPAKRVIKPPNRNRVFHHEEEGKDVQMKDESVKPKP